MDAFYITMAAVLASGILVPRSLSFTPALAGLGLFLAHAALFRTRPPLPLVFIGWLCVFPALGALSALWAVDPGEALERAWKTALVLIPGGFLAATAARISLPEGKIRHLLPAIFILCGAALAAELWLDMPGYRLWNHIPGDMRVRADRINRNVVFLVLAALPVCLPMLADLRSNRRWLAACAGVVALVMTGTASQSAQLCLALALAVFFVFPVRMRTAWIVLAALIAAAIFAAPWIAPPLFGLFAEKAAHASILEDAWIANRLEIWDYVGRYIQKNPLYGFGMEATKAIQDFDTGQVYQRGKGILHPHNFALQLWIEFGISGALAGTALIVHALQIAGREPDILRRRIQICTLTGLLSIGAMSYGLWQGWWLGLIVFCAALVRLPFARRDEISGGGAAVPESQVDDERRRPDQRGQKN